MGEIKFTLIDLGGLSGTASVLLEKISEGIGGLAYPWQAKRKAIADAEAEKIRTLAEIETDELLEKRALTRFVAEEKNKQSNIESITEKAITDLSEAARPQDMENDWVANFFDKCKLVSDEQMQALWARILAGEANSPGSYSKRTVNHLASLDKSDAELFTCLHRFCWMWNNTFHVIVISFMNQFHPIYDKYGFTFDAMIHLSSIGLIEFEALTTFSETKVPRYRKLSYHGQEIMMQLRSEDDNDFDLGHVLLTKVGEELAMVCDSPTIEEFYDLMIQTWITQKYILSSEWPRLTVEE